LSRECRATLKTERQDAGGALRSKLSPHLLRDIGADDGQRLAFALASGDWGDMLKVRVIPVWTRRTGAPVKGVNFVDLRDAGDPVALAPRVRRARGRRALLPRHHGEPRKSARP